MLWNLPHLIDIIDMNLKSNFFCAVTQSYFNLAYNEIKQFTKNTLKLLNVCINFH